MKSSVKYRFNTSIKTFFLVLLLMLMFVNYAGYGYYVFYLPFLYLFFHKGFRLIDKTFLFILFWGVSYGMLSFLNSGIIGYSSVLMPMLNFPILYLIGRYLGYYNNKESWIDILFLFSIALALIPVLSVFKDIGLNGFYSMDIRNIPLIGFNGNSTLNATNISSCMMPLGSFFVFILFPYKIKKRIIFVGSAFIVFYCSLRLQSRTTILSAILLFAMVVVLTFKSRSIKEKFILSIGILFIFTVVLYILFNYSDELAILNRFQNGDIASGGGRKTLMLGILDNMWRYPFGGMDKDFSYYAHNLWLDSARIAGIFPFFMLVFLTIRYIYLLVKCLFSRDENFYIKLVLGILSYSLFIVFMGEPVLEGAFMCFSLFCILFGMLSLKKNNRNCY